MRIAGDATIYIADRTRRIRRIGTDGVIRAIAGEGNAITEGEPSTGAGFFNSFIDMAIAEDGTLYVSGGGAKVHRIDTGGRIYTAAGSGVFAGRRRACDRAVLLARRSGDRPRRQPAAAPQ